MMKREQFLTVMASFTTMRQHYNRGETQANVTVQRGLKAANGSVCDMAKLSISGPIPVFIALGGILWGMTAAMDCTLHAWIFNGRATWDITAMAEPEGGTGE
jgi:hypothetical protein